MPNLRLCSCLGNSYKAALYIMREIGIILIIDFSFPEEETYRAQHLSLAFNSSSKAESNEI